MFSDIEIHVDRPLGGLRAKPPVLVLSVRTHAVECKGLLELTRVLINGTRHFAKYMTRGQLACFVKLSIAHFSPHLTFQ